MTPSRSSIRYALGLLLAFGALNAIAGGYYGLSGAPGVPVEWLAGSPFEDYFIPSLILFVGVGGSLGFAALAVLAGFRVARRSALIAGTIVLAWVIVQVAVIGYVSWMQPGTFIGGLAVLVLAWQLPPSEAGESVP
jgi:hypothetical protein